MSDLLTPERIAELRAMCDPPWCMEGGVEVLSNDLPVSDLAALLDAAEENSTLRAEVGQAKRMNAELRKDVRARDSHIEGLESENATLRAERARLKEAYRNAEGWRRAFETQVPATITPLPCPFCGCEKVVVNQGRGTEPPIYWAQCNSDAQEPLDCIGEGPQADTPDEAVQKWNRRTADAENARLRDLLVRAQDRWMPIETAPKDGTFIMVLRGQWMAIAWWGKTINGHMAWCHDAGFFPSWDLPTHYRPKPLTPAEEAELDALLAQNG